MKKGQLIELLETILKKYGYSYHAPINICDTNSNTLYVGSSTNTYLTEIENDTFRGENYTIQPCFRTQNLKSYDYLLSHKEKGVYKSFFDMFGTMKYGRLENEDLKDYISILTAVFGFSTEQLIIVLPKEKEDLKDYIINTLNIKKIKIVSNERFTKWKYGISGLIGTGITVYTAYNGAAVQILDIVEIINEKNNNIYVECCFAIDNMRIKNKEYDLMYDIYKLDIDILNYYEFVFWDSLVATCELFSEGIRLPKWTEDYQRSHIFKRYIKYMLLCNKKMKNTDDQLYQYIDTFFKSKNIFDESKQLELQHIIKKVKKNMLDSIKSYKKYCSTLTNEDFDQLKQKYGIIEI
jgi:hypothetical protein